MAKKSELSVKEKKENVTVLDDTWEGLDNFIVEEGTRKLKAMTDSQLRRQGEIENIPNYLTMAREELLNALINKLVEEIKKKPEENE